MPEIAGAASFGRQELRPPGVWRGLSNPALLRLKVASTDAKPLLESWNSPLEYGGAQHPLKAGLQAPARGPWEIFTGYPWIPTPPPSTRLQWDQACAPSLTLLFTLPFESWSGSIHAPSPPMHFCMRVRMARAGPMRDFCAHGYICRICGASDLLIAHGPGFI